MKILKHEVSDLYELPGDPIHFGLDPRGVLCLWVEGDHAPYSTYRVLGTGETVDEGEEHIGTAVEGPYVWHLYRRF